MNPRNLISAFCALAFLAPVAHAARTVTSESKTLQEWAGTGLCGDPLLSTAMYFPLQSATFDLSAMLRSGTTAGTVSIFAHGYPVGTYTVAAVSVSSSASTVLGTLEITTPAFSGSDPGIFNGLHPDFVIGGPLPPISFTTGTFSTSTFPAGLSPFDLATLSLSDSTGAVIATGTLTPVQSGYLSAVSPLVSTGSAGGFAVLRAKTPPVFLPMAVFRTAIPVDPPPFHFHPNTGTIALHAHGLAPSAAYTCALDSTVIGVGTSDASGNLKFFAAQGAKLKIPVSLDLFSVKTLTLLDSGSNVVLSTGF